MRYGLLARGFGDKEVLFHLLLAPFTRLFEPATGGRVALALLGALALAAIGQLSRRAVGTWGLLVPFWLLLTATQFSWRLVRLRPELLSLLLLLLALWLAVRRRYRWLAPVGALYALSYTAIHAFAGLFGLLFLAAALVERRWEWPLIVYPLLGAGVGLLVHPHFPHNLTVWWFVAVEFFRLQGALDVGTEIRPGFTDVTLLANLGWWLGLAVLWRSARPRGPAGDSRPALFFGVAALVFGGLYLLMSRFVLYAVPFVTLWLLFELRRRRLRVGEWLALPGERSVPAWTGWLLCLLAALPITAGEVERFQRRVDPGPGAIRIRDREELARAMPEGAWVAAPWGQTPIYMFWAPQGRYLNVLDPGLLAFTDPAIHAAQRDIFDGSEPDVPGRSLAALKSPFLAYNASTGHELLTRRLLGDPRAEIVHRRLHALVRFRTPPPGTFVLGWRLAPEGSTPPLDSELVETWPFLGGAGELRGPDVRGYVDLARVTGRGRCRTAVRSLELAEPQAASFEFAPYGPGELWLDGRIVAQLRGETEAVLGEGLLLPLDLSAGEHSLAVVTCPSRERDRAGFYLVRRG